MSFIVYFITYFFFGAIVIFDLFIAIKFFEHACCVIVLHQPPLVASHKISRQCVIDQIKSNYMESKNIIDIGSGFGGLARDIARNTKANVYALENMLGSAMISKITDWLCGCKNNKTIWCDAFKYLDKTNINIDVAVAYLSPTLTPKLYKYKDKINVLISIDFEMTGVKPTKTIFLGNGGTIYGGVKYPRKIFIYEFKRQ